MTLTETVAARWRAAFNLGDLEELGALLHDDVRWGGDNETPEVCHHRSEVLNRLAVHAAKGVHGRIVDAASGAEAFWVELDVRRPVDARHQRQHRAYQTLALRDGRVVDIRGYSSRREAAAAAGVRLDKEPQAMQARSVTPILNVSSIAASFDWFEHFGWSRQWAWGERDAPPSFGAVASGELEIFISERGQGAQGTWLSIWVDDVDAVHAVCLRHNLDIVRQPQDEPWGIREMHVRHPDGHIFRVSQPIHHH